MHICRFNRDRLGLVEDDHVFDVTNVLEHLPALIWPASPGDQFIAHLVMLREHMLRSRLSAPFFALSEEIGRAHVCTPVTNAHLECRLMPDTKKTTKYKNK